MHFKRLFIFLQNAIISLIQYIRDFLEYGDYYIKRAEILYTRNEVKLVDDITYEYRKFGSKKIIDEISPEVVEFLFRITYFFNNKQYIYLTRNTNHVFPLVKKAITFCLPVREATLLDNEGKPVFDVTNHVKMYAGPTNDFHGENIRLRDIELEYPKIRLTNILGNTVEYDTARDEINHLTLWSPSKT